MELKLAQRLAAGVVAWTSALKGVSEDTEDIPMDTDLPDKPVTHKLGGNPKVGNTAFAHNIMWNN